MSFEDKNIFENKILPFRIAKSFKVSELPESIVRYNIPSISSAERYNTTNICMNFTSNSEMFENNNNNIPFMNNAKVSDFNLTNNNIEKRFDDISFIEKSFLSRNFQVIFK